MLAAFTNGRTGGWRAAVPARLEARSSSSSSNSSLRWAERSRPSVRAAAKRRPNLAGLVNQRVPPPPPPADDDAPPPPPLTDWSALAAVDPPPPSDIDPDVAASINELATAAARAMLAGDARALGQGSPWRADVLALGDYCTTQARAGAAAGSPPDPASPGMQGALLAYLLLEMAEGRWPADQADALVGPWRAAAEKMHGIVEDVGWKLVLPDEEEEEEEEEEGAEAA